MPKLKSQMRLFGWFLSHKIHKFVQFTKSQNSLIHELKKLQFFVKLHTIILGCRIMHFKWHKMPEKTTIFLKDCWAYGNISWVDRDDEFARVFATILRTYSGASSRIHPPPPGGQLHIHELFSMSFPARFPIKALVNSFAEKEALGNPLHSTFSFF